ncbi:nucleotide kinase domain-containing protein [Nodularia spumigena]|uniref:nucleotide kinase domain-containing protein n=1 Tax=Nodularia spumigena TaxID=70799 RepID=UPI00232B9E22|nr:nucleotide kinase domain-containing protein [Nodularia spumigena]MDB9304246.1 putative DNA base hypermodification protein [Nodularia spumigena CS-591/12]MDB9316639.1 putative DNA base hypermodification protein [Nodularia spumigena CS-590/01A]MDB9326171.1 putative DNA base hypermodification protein [Nodularia spumigena CS-590/02]MDB9336790.1 putative DNA base hypermodification protein [Nodularia spumigena CS-590/01]MDB9361821.1 putative DNA base hypermodification protein [Nodularia spumigena
MQVRQEIFDTYWRFAAMRQEVFFNKIQNVPPPWTSDPILNTYKFCNAYRASDRVSQYLIKNIIYGENRSQNEEEVILRILLFKIFNKIETWEYLENQVGDYITLFNFNSDAYSNILESAMDLGYVIYTSAYMSCASKEFGYDKKHQNHLALIDKMVVKDRVINPIVKAKTFEDVFHIIQGYPLLGKFMAYQLATDINYSEVINFDENSFTIAGPGAERGIDKCFIDTEGKTYTDIIHWITENQEKEFQRLGLNFQSLWGRPLQAIDCQNLFCETDKYCRAAFPDLKSNRKRIKAKFTPTPQPIDYFYPPKWRINDKVQETLAQRLPALENSHLQQLNNSNSQQLSLELDSTVKTTSEISKNLLKQSRKYKQETEKKKSKALQNADTETSQQLCLF